MSKEMVIASNRHETKVAVLEDDQLVEIYFQRANEYSLAGSIHKGRVTRVLPGMQSAFVDLGLERDTFLYVSDFFEEHDDIETFDEKPVRDRRDRAQPRGPERVEERGAPAAAAPSSEEAELAEPKPPAPVVDASVVPASSEPQASEGPNDETTEGGRGFRDRRGRRGRRRRTHGRGFPESKYARPEAVPSVQSEPSGNAEQDPSEVLILPGESLAKYRSAPHTVEVSEGSRNIETQATEEPPGSLPREGSEPATDTEQAEDLESEAEEIELADKVLSHHDEDEPVEAEEEKLAEVKQDTDVPIAVSEAGSAPADDEDRSGSASAMETGAYERSGVRPSWTDEISEIEPAESKVVSIDEGPIESIDAAEYATRELDESPEPEIEEEFEGVSEASFVEAAPPESTQPEAPQRAFLRGPGERYLHRVPRRMRRRRGRFSQSFGQSEASDLSVAGAGAAAAMEPRRAETRREAPEGERTTPSIADLLKPGQEIIVQIAKEPLGQKGARITSHIALPGRYVVFMPSINHLGVSRKIASEEERQRLKRILQRHRVGASGGFIVRTAGEGVPENDIAADMNFLYNLWLDIRQKAEEKPAPTLLHYDLDIVERILRDQLDEDFKAIWVDSEDMYQKVIDFTQRFQPSLVSRVKMYTRAAPIFDAFNITQELEKALRPKVWLKSGGYIVINQTEALVAIDINTGKYVGKSNRLEDTIVKTNLEAAREIVRQIRLRDLGGIIVVDFIDMDERKNRQRVMQGLEEAMRADRAPYKILQFNDFGLVAITRKRVKQSLERALCAPCPYCDGAGYVKSVQTVIGEILVEAHKLAKAIEGKEAVLRVHPDVAKVLKASSNRYLEEIEEILGRPVLVKGDPVLHHEKFDLA